MRSHKRAKGPDRPRQKPGECELTVWGVPADVKRRFKIACAGKQATMKDVLIQLMREYAK